MSRSLQISMFHNLRLASMTYHNAHSKNGVNVSQRLVVNAYLNMATRSGEDKSEAIALTAWNKGADILAICLTPGKEFTAICDLNVYTAPVYHNNQIVSVGGAQLTRKAYGYTIRQFDLGNDSFKHIMDEIQRGVRGPNWWMKGHPDYENFRALLKGRMGLVGHFDPSIHAAGFGFAPVKLAQGAGIGAYIPGQKADSKTMPAATFMNGPGAATTPQAVAAAFGVRPAVSVAPTAQPINPANSFVVPAGV
jgi:hypothetical protein